MSAITHGFEDAQFQVGHVEAQAEAGAYLRGRSKQLFESTLVGSMQPSMSFLNGLTQLAIHRSVTPSNLYIDVRDGEVVPKITTMAEPAPGETRDVNPYSERILNVAARIARVVGLDEIPQIDLIDTTTDHMIGVRKLQKNCADKVSVLARQDDEIPEEDIELWRDWQKNGPTGLLAPAQALRKFRRFRLDNVPGAAMTVKEDIKYIRETDSVRKDVLVALRSINILANAVVFATPGHIWDAVTTRRKQQQVIDVQL